MKKKDMKAAVRIWLLNAKTKGFADLDTICNFIDPEGEKDTALFVYNCVDRIAYRLGLLVEEDSHGFHVSEMV